MITDTFVIVLDILILFSDAVGNACFSTENKHIFSNQKIDVIDGFRFLIKTESSMHN